MKSTVTSQPVSSIQTMTRQPVHGGWMVDFADCPHGLGYLTLINQLLIKQQTEIWEAVFGFETKNKYDILNSVGQRIYYAEEDTNCLLRICFGRMRSFDINIFDNYMVEVIHLHRPLRCSGWCCCCLQELEVQAPPGITIGYVREVCDPCYPRFVLNNAKDQTVLHVKGNSCCVCHCFVARFEVSSNGEGGLENVRGNLSALETIQIRGMDNTTRVGMITKRFGGLPREIFTDADSFTVTLPLDLDVRMKATAIGASFLFDYIYFER